MDSLRSDDENVQEAAAGEGALSKKMKLAVIMLSLVLIILLLPLASNHGLPLLKPMGNSMLQRLWDAMRFIAMTTAISIGIISTSSQRNEKGFDRSAHLRSSSSTHRSSAHIASSSREPNYPDRINHSDMDRSEPPYLHQVSPGKEVDNSQKLKGKQVMNGFSTAANGRGEEIYSSGSPSMCTPFQLAEDEGYENFKQKPVHMTNRLSAINAWSSASGRGEEIYSSESPSVCAHSRLASNQDEDYENFKQKPVHAPNRFSAINAWSSASRIDEETEEEYVAGASHEISSSRPLEESRIESRKKSPPIDDKVFMSRSSKEIKSADRSLMNVYASMTDDNYAELRMRKAAISHLADEIHPANGKGHRRSSSVDRRRPIHYEDQGPDRPGLKQILMDVSKERAVSTGKLSNLSSGNRDYTANRKMSNLGKQSYRPHSADANIDSTTSIQRSVKVSEQHNVLTETLSSDLNQMIKQSGAESKVSCRIVYPEQREAIKKNADQISQKEADNAKVGSNDMFQSKRVGGVIEMGPNQMRQNQDDANMGTDQKMKADQASKGVQMPSTRFAEHNGGDLQSTLHKANLSSRSKLLLQSTKHSRSALNLEQLEQQGNTLHVKPPAGPSVKKKRSFSCDFGDGFTPDWLLELEPPPPPGFIDQQNMMTSPPEANQSTLKNADSSNLVQNLVPWRSSVPIDISGYPRARSPVSPPDMFSRVTSPSPGELNRRADEFISNFTTKLIKQRQESLERRKQYN